MDHTIQGGGKAANFIEPGISFTANHLQRQKEGKSLEPKPTGSLEVNSQTPELPVSCSAPFKVLHILFIFTCCNSANSCPYPSNGMGLPLLCGKIPTLGLLYLTPQHSDCKHLIIDSFPF